MPHSPKPFFKKNRNAWYVEVDRVQHLLGKHPADLPPPQKRGGRWLPPEPILTIFYKQTKLVRKNEVMAELMEAHTELKKSLGEP